MTADPRPTSAPGPAPSATAACTDSLVRSGARPLSGGHDPSHPVLAPPDRPGHGAQPHRGRPDVPVFRRGRLCQRLAYPPLLGPRCQGPDWLSLRPPASSAMDGSPMAAWGSTPTTTKPPLARALAAARRSPGRQVRHPARPCRPQGVVATSVGRRRGAEGDQDPWPTSPLGDPVRRGLARTQGAR